MPYRNFYAALDACKVADYVVFVLSSSVEVDPWGDTLLRTLQAQGLPEVVSVVSPDAQLDPKSRPGVLKSLLSFIQYFVPEQTRIFDLHVGSDRLSALRSLSEGKPADVRWKEGRCSILGESVSWEDGVLKVTGVVRGTSLSPNRLVHIPSFGDYQVSQVGFFAHTAHFSLNILFKNDQIFSAPSPRPSKGANTQTMEVEPALLVQPDSDNADSLVSSNEPDDLANEQTWPTEEEMSGQPTDAQSEIPDAHDGTTPRSVRRIPKGMSEYQAAWIVDEDDQEGEDDEDEKRGTDEAGMEEIQEDEEEMQDMQMEEIPTEVGGVRFEDLDVEEEEIQCVKRLYPLPIC